MYSNKIGRNKLWKEDILIFKYNEINLYLEYIFMMNIFIYVQKVIIDHSYSNIYIENGY